MTLRKSTADFGFRPSTRSRTRATCPPRRKRRASSRTSSSTSRSGRAVAAQGGWFGVHLGQVIEKLPYLKLRGILSYDGGVRHLRRDSQNRKERALKTIDTERGNVRRDEEGRVEHGNLQRWRHRNLQHHAARARIYGRAGGLGRVHGHAIASAIGSESGDPVYTDSARRSRSLTTVDERHVPVDHGGRAAARKH